MLKVVLVTGVLAVLVAAALGARWWSQPSLFGKSGFGAFSAAPRPVAKAALSTTVIWPKTDGEPETVTINDAQAIFSKNSVKATATFWVCHMGAGESPIGAVHDPQDACQDIVPLEAGASYLHGVAPDSDYLVVTITPTRRGVAHLERVEVDYVRTRAHLYQQGTESLDVDCRITAT